MVKTVCALDDRGLPVSLLVTPLQDHRCDEEWSAHLGALPYFFFRQEKTVIFPTPSPLDGPWEGGSGDPRHFQNPNRKGRSPTLQVVQELRRCGELSPTESGAPL
jgi:hypothetical protein